MGILNPVCTATNGKRIFALAFAASYNDSSSSYNVLIQSNEYPSDTLQYTTWTLVNAVPRDQYFYLQDENFNGRGYGCVVDDKGVFTALARFSQLSKSSPVDTVVRGIQFVPSEGPASGSGFATPGTWKNIATSPSYVWKESASAQLYNVVDPATGQRTIMHASVTSQGNDSGIVMAALDTTTMTMVQNPAPWKLDIPQVGVVRAVGFASNNTFFAIGQNLTNDYFASEAVSTMQIVGGSTAPPALSAINYSNAMDLAFHCGNDLPYLTVLPWKERLVILCKDMRPGPIYTTIYYVDSKTPLKEYDSMPGTFDNLRSLLSVQGNSNSYMFMYNSSGTYSIPLDGASSIYRFTASTTRISIPDAYGVYNPDINSPSPSGGGTSTLGPNPNTNGNSGSGGGSNGGLIGGVVAAVALIATVAGFFFVRKRRQYRAAKNSAVDSTPSSTTHGLAAHSGSDEGIIEKLIPSAPPVERAMKSDVTDSWPTHPAAPYFVGNGHDNNVGGTSSAANGEPLYRPGYSPVLPTPFSGLDNLQAPSPHSVLPVPVHDPHGSVISSPLNSDVLSLPPETSTSISMAMSRHTVPVALPLYWEPKPFVPPVNNSNNHGPIETTAIQPPFTGTTPAVPLFWEPKPFVPPSLAPPATTTNINSNDNIPNNAARISTSNIYAANINAANINASDMNPQNDYHSTSISNFDTATSHGDYISGDIHFRHASPSASGASPSMSSPSASSLWSARIPQSLPISVNADTNRAEQEGTSSRPDSAPSSQVITAPLVPRHSKPN
ncbi:hypothetical protein EDD11_009273 [Mortierella claussenii]|nr:hypothetical protein EDD11_009273 [Mortierella claussenii]